MATKTTTGAPVSVKKLSIMTLAIMNIVAVVSLRGLPAEAEYGSARSSTICLRRSSS
ncbi:putative glutamate/gamma-aminobutyrate antiporter [Edwardsiella tarda]|nr:putative glutamate/gamma-aminobutyrate antiporter [Edwardsiella tarda]